MSDNSMYTGVKVINTTKELIDQIYINKELDISLLDGRYKLQENQNQYVILNNKVYDEQHNEIYAGSASIITKVKNNKLVKINIDKTKTISGVNPRNKEQAMAFDALLDEEIKVVTLTGNAGCGKTLVTLSAALHLMDKGAYDRIILTRQMYQVGKIDLGILPGEIESRFGPYLKNYMCNFEHLLGSRRSTQDLIAYYNIEFLPFQLIRGASWPNTIIIADEFQNADIHELLTLGTRVGDNSKIVVMGDLSQRDTKITKEKTGMFYWVNHNKVKSSELTASIHLLKNERSLVSKLFSEVLTDI